MATHCETLERAVLDIFRMHDVTPGKFLRFSQLRAQWPSRGLAANELVQGLHALENAGHITFQDVDMGPFLVLTQAGHARMRAG